MKDNIAIINSPTNIELRCTGITESTSFVKSGTHVFWSMTTAYENAHLRMEPRKNVYVIHNIGKDNGKEEEDSTET